MTVQVPCPICGAQLDVPQTTDDFGNPFWDANTAIADHVAEVHPDQQQQGAVL